MADHQRSENENDPEATTSDDNNPYLAMRQAKIARNQARLKELGLLSLEDKSRPNLSSRKRPRSAVKIKSHPTPPTRRSRRLKQQEDEATDDKKEGDLQALDDDYFLKEEARLSRSKAPTKKVTSKALSSSSYQVKPNSVKTVSLDIPKLIDNLLGKVLPYPGKECCLDESFRIAASKDDQERLDGIKLSFNKYSGVQEWASGIVFLWVNLGKPSDDIVNEFLVDNHTQSIQMTWFGGSRMHDESPVVQTLLKVGQGPPEKSTIVLWCRQWIVEKKTFSPYTCLGRCSYVSHIPGSSPLSFVWNLVDYDRLVSHPDKQTRETFQELISK